jgi:hypothetical protein
MNEAKSLCWECEKPLSEDEGARGRVGGYLRKDKAKICKKCYESIFSN